MGTSKGKEGKERLIASLVHKFQVAEQERGGEKSTEQESKGPLKSPRGAYIEGKLGFHRGLGFPKSFIRRHLMAKLDYSNVNDVVSVLKHRFEACVACTDDTKDDFKVKRDHLVWKTGIPSNDGSTYAVISIPLSSRSPFEVEWRRGRPRNIVRIHPAPIPAAFQDHVIVNGHSLGRSVERSGHFVDQDAIYSLITAHISQGTPLTRVYYKPDGEEGSIQWLMPGSQADSIFVIRADYECGHVFTATSLDAAMAEILRQTANPLTHKGVYQSRKGVEA